jgi:hypothetical protein
VRPTRSWPLFVRQSDALEGAAEEAEKGMLGRQSLACSSPTSCLIDALEAVDVEFARRSGTYDSLD